MAAAPVLRRKTADLLGKRPRNISKLQRFVQ
jgi:hypothetical protein